MILNLHEVAFGSISEKFALALRVLGGFEVVGSSLKLKVGVIVVVVVVVVFVVVVVVDVIVVVVVIVVDDTGKVEGGNILLPKSLLPEKRGNIHKFM